VHRGHVRVIDAARRAGLRTSVVTFDPHPRAVLGRDVELLATLERRLELLHDAGVEDVLVLRFDERLAALPADEFAERMLRGIGAETVAAGETFRFGRGREGDLELLERLGFDVRRVPLVENVSSSRVRELVHAGDTERAATLLGRPPEVEGIVVRGDGRGRELGFPTANLDVPEGRPTVCTPAGPKRGGQPCRSGRTRTSTESSAASRRTCSTSTATSMASGSWSRSGLRFVHSAASTPSTSSSRRSETTSSGRARLPDPADPRLQESTRGSATQPMRATPGRGKSLRQDMSVASVLSG